MIIVNDNRQGLRWNDGEDRVLLELLRRRVPAATVAAILGRTRSSVYQRRFLLRHRPVQAGQVQQVEQVEQPVGLAEVIPLRGA